jgi:thiol-disulfide isomerase/thioredoxin
MWRALKWLFGGIAVFAGAIGLLVAAMWISPDVRYGVAFWLAENFDLNPPVTAVELEKQTAALKRVTLIDAAGKTFDWNAKPRAVIWVNQWANWCVPCRMEFADMKALQDRVGRDRLRIVLLSQPKYWEADKRTAKELGLPFEMAVPRNASPHDAKAIDFGIMPSSTFMRANGEGIMAVRAPRPWNSAAWAEIVSDWYAKGR